MLKTLLFGIIGEIIKDIAHDAEMRKTVSRGVKRAYRKRSAAYTACPTCDGTGFTARSSQDRPAQAQAPEARTTPASSPAPTPETVPAQAPVTA